MASHVTFILMNVFVILQYIYNNVSKDTIQAVMRLLTLLVLSGFIGVFIILNASGTSKLSGRILTLIDPSYAKNHAPLIASISEHAPSVWVNYFMDINYIVVLVPIGFYYTLCYKLTAGKLFVGMWGVFSVYFSSVMTRLSLVLAPAACIIAGISMSYIVAKATKVMRLSVVGIADYTQS